MTAGYSAAIIFALSAILLTWISAFVFYRQYRRDRLRHQLLLLRNELFDLAASGSLPFDGPSYLAWNDAIEQARRGVPRLTLTRLAFTRAFPAIRTVAVPAALGELNGRLNDALFRHIFSGYGLLRKMYPRRDSSFPALIEAMTAGSPR